jgi:hypothetical protein
MPNSFDDGPKDVSHIFWRAADTYTLGHVRISGMEDKVDNEVNLSALFFQIKTHKI